MKNKTIINQFSKVMQNINVEGDERQSLESHKIISIGMMALIGSLTMLSIIYDTIYIPLNIDLSSSDIFTLVSLIIGLVCLLCGFALCKRGLVSGLTQYVIIFYGVFFPPFILSDLIYFIFKGYEKEVANIALLIIPIGIFTSYYILNKIYQKAIYELENEDSAIN